MFKIIIEYLFLLFLRQKIRNTLVNTIQQTKKSTLPKEVEKRIFKETAYKVLGPSINEKYSVEDTKLKLKMSKILDEEIDRCLNKILS